ncbi:hypothetical protein THAOC_28143, partial [Thalassiosira oceanica]
MKGTVDGGRVIVGEIFERRLPVPTEADRSGRKSRLARRGQDRWALIRALKGGGFRPQQGIEELRGESVLWAFLFLSVPFRDTLDSNYDTNKTQLDEAPFGRADDDYGPGSEPPPHDRLRYVSTFMPSRRRPPAAVGKPSFPRFKVYYLLRRRVRFEPRPLDFRERDLPNATAYGDPKASTTISGIRGM